MKEIEKKVPKCPTPKCVGLIRIRHQYKALKVKGESTKFVNKWKCEICKTTF